MDELIKIISLDYLGDDRGGLVSLQSNQNIPFEIKRVYYLFATQEGVARGFHAHKELKQVAIALHGSCRFILDDGKQRQEIILDSPLKGLYIDNNKWREMHDFSNDCVLVVIASEHYDESDYIRDYQDFLKEVINV
ncbi:sugar 3,4-ketoisomerase [Shewanella sp. HL-SH8]|uniref:sugar 3,4-ketoisomerase n=1 Tax=Shewanella sp. HL-SH8 TaxID=3436242 RepID=UPI003EBE2457